jgi:hypothetical protein
MRSVYAERENQIKETLDRIQKMKLEYEAEGKRLEEEVARDCIYTREKRLQEKKRVDEYKAALAQQVEDKISERERERITLEDERDEEKRRTDELQTQIENEREKQRKLIKQLF